MHPIPALRVSCVQGTALQMSWKGDRMVGVNCCWTECEFRFHINQLRDLEYMT